MLAWLAGETWKLVAYQTYQKTGDTRTRTVPRHRPQDAAQGEDAEITPPERQLGKGGELASGFGGSVGAWRRIMPHDPRTDEEIKAIINAMARGTSSHHASSGTISRVPSGSPSAPGSRSWSRHLRVRRSSPPSATAI